MTNYACWWTFHFEINRAIHSLILADSNFASIAPLATKTKYQVVQGFVEARDNDAVSRVHKRLSNLPLQAICTMSCMLAQLAAIRYCFQALTWALLRAPVVFILHLLPDSTAVIRDLRRVVNNSTIPDIHPLLHTYQCRLRVLWDLLNKLPIAVDVSVTPPLFHEHYCCL